MQIANFKNYLTLIASISSCLLVGYLGGIATSSGVNSWYNTIIKPSFTPPNSVFPIVWTILYIMMGFSWGLIINKTKSFSNSYKKANILFILQLFFNAIWSFIYFRFHQIGLAWLDINLLLISLIFTIHYFNKIENLASYLLIPYLLWVIYADILNGIIWWLNF